MSPIVIFVLEYAACFLFLAAAAYVSISIVAGRNQLGKRLFLAILAFGGCALAGYFVAGLVQYWIAKYLHTHTEAIGEPNRAVIATAYFVPGLIGAWISWKKFKPST
jgi:hypothetical protein